MPIDTETAEIQKAEDLIARIERRAAEICQHVLLLCDGNDAAAHEFQDKFLEAVKDIERVSITPIPKAAGAFLVSEGTLKIDESTVLMVLDAVNKQLAQDAAQGVFVSQDQIFDLFEKVFVVYMLHELRHRTQGVELYSIVQELKSIAGGSAMASIDASADRDAAVAYARIYRTDDTRMSFLSTFQEALFLSGTFFWKVFPPDKARTDKMERALAVVFMAARFAGVDLSPVVENSTDLPLDSGLTVALSDDHQSLALYRSEPSAKLLGVAGVADGVHELVTEVGKGRFQAALERAHLILRRLKLLSS